MLPSPSDMYVLLEVNNDSVVTSQPMILDDVMASVLTKYGDQPLRYFNEYKRLKVIHLKSGTIKEVNLKVDF